MKITPQSTAVKSNRDYSALPATLRLEMLAGHMADVLAEMREAVNQFHASAQHVRLQSQIDFVKEVLYRLDESHRALVANVKGAK
jgi:hypothetical protein